MKYEFHDGPLDGCIMNFPRDVSEIIIGTPCKLEGDKPDHYTGVYLRRYFDFGDGYMGLAGDTTMSVQDINYTFSESKPMNRKRRIECIRLTITDEALVAMLPQHAEYLDALHDDYHGETVVFFECDATDEPVTSRMYRFEFRDTMTEFEDEQFSGMSYAKTLKIDKKYKHLYTGYAK